jgi:adenosylhomocysteine nucleosidase
MIIVTFALSAESKSFVAQLQERRTSNSEVGKIISGRIGPKSVTVFHTGVGRHVAQKRLTDFLAEQSCEILISSGFAGGVDPNLSAGDLFLARNVSDSELLEYAQQSLRHLQPHAGKLLTSSGIIHSAKKRMEVARERAADAIDMESDGIAQTCAERGIRMLSLRAISDTARAPFPAPPDVLFDVERQKTNLLLLATHLLLRPTKIGSFVRFAAQIKHAREHLTQALVALLSGSSFRVS